MSQYCINGTYDTMARRNTPVDFVLHAAVLLALSIPVAYLGFLLLIALPYTVLREPEPPDYHTDLAARASPDSSARERASALYLRHTKLSRQITEDASFVRIGSIRCSWSVSRASHGMTRKARC